MIKSKPYDHTRTILLAVVLILCCLLLYLSGARLVFGSGTSNGTSSAVVLGGQPAAVSSGGGGAVGAQTSSVGTQTLEHHLQPHAAGMANCLDGLVLFHEDDKPMFVDNGGFESAKAHLKGVRKFFVISASDASFKHLIDERVQWVDEKVAPFRKQDFEGCRRPAGWLYQQTLKMWAVAHLDITCNDLIVLDSDLMWIRDLDVRVPTPQPHEPLDALGSDTRAPVPVMAGGPFKYMYCLSSMDSGAWYGDITNGEYQHYVNWLLGMPKVLADTHTAINNWQVMQRDVMLALEASLEQRGLGKLQDALKAYGKQFNGMSEYEAYFSFVWTNYRERVMPVYLPWALRAPKTCNYHNEAMVREFREKTPMVYLTCHDNYPDNNAYYINCKMRDGKCDPRNS